MSELAKRFIDFSAASSSPFHAIDLIKDQLENAGFEKLNEYSTWKLENGKKYYVTRNHSSVIAFAVPENGFSPFRIVASHSDSPVFKLKPVFEENILGGKYVRLNTERYGGMIMSTWLDRPLGIAGRVMLRGENGIVERMVDLERDAVLIPNMPIHFNREVNTGFNFNPQVDLLPVYALGKGENALLREIADKANVKAVDIIAQDLYLYSRVPGSVWGIENELFSCGRIDDLECAWTSLQAFVQAKHEKEINVLCVFDNEEVGSGSKQGAGGDFLDHTLNRIGVALGKTAAEILPALNASFMISADNAHALHPNHPEKYDADNRTFMNEGIVIKQNASQKYTTDAVSAAVFSEICRMSGSPVQYFANRSDLPGGSTLGNIANAHVSMNTVDIGLAQLAMHSSYETAGCKDVEYMINALKAFYETGIVFDGNGGITLA